MSAPDVNNVVTRARRLLKERTDSLQKDVCFCILDNAGHRNWPAPFPALLYCFSTIDLMGALFWKCTLTDKIQQAKCDQDIERGVSNKSLNYMLEFMRYPELEANLIQKIFRHKLVHLAQPLPISEYCGKKYSWRYLHNDRSQHLRFREDGVTGTSAFQVSIWSLTEDIVDSIIGPNGYLERISTDTSDAQRLRDRFNKAYENCFQING